MAAATTATAAKQPTYKDNIGAMYTSYEGKKEYKDGYISLPSKSMSNLMFLGSAQAIFLSSRSTMEHESPACVAAPLVNMVAKEAISLGMKSQKPTDRVVIYAPEQLSISAPHVKIGHILFMISPRAAFITCKKLTLSKFKGPDPDYFPIVKSWLVNPDTVIETIENSPEEFFDVNPGEKEKK